MGRTGRTGRTQIVAALLVASAQAAEAQIIRPTLRSRPAAWTSVAASYVRMRKAIHDGPSNSWWNFGEAVQYRGSIELPMGDVSSFGVAMTTSRMPLVYAGTATANSCTLCDANMTVQQYFGVMHLGIGSTGFQEVLDLSAGATRFSNIQQTSGSPLGTGKAVTDLTFAIAYGVGYSFTRGLQVHLMQEYSLVAHKRVAGTPSNTAQQQTTRIGLRLALGAR